MRRASLLLSALLIAALAPSVHAQGQEVRFWGDVGGASVGALPSGEYSVRATGADFVGGACDGEVRLEGWDTASGRPESIFDEWFAGHLDDTFMVGPQPYVVTLPFTGVYTATGHLRLADSPLLFCSTWSLELTPMRPAPAPDDTLAKAACAGASAGIGAAIISKLRGPAGIAAAILAASGGVLCPAVINDLLR